MTIFSKIKQAYKKWQARGPIPPKVSWENCNAPNWVFNRLEKRLWRLQRTQYTHGKHYEYKAILVPDFVSCNFHSEYYRRRRIIRRQGVWVKK